MTVDFLLGPAFPFSLAVVFVGMLFLVELVGLSLGALDMDLFDLDHDGHIDSRALDWMGVGRLPVLIMLAVFLLSFATIGLAIQMHIGLPVFLAVVIAVAGSLPAGGVISHFLSMAWPHDETTAIHQDRLRGKRATIISALGIKGAPAEAKVKDEFGQVHYVNVEPHSDTELKQGDVVLLAERRGTVWTAIDPTGGFRPSE